MTYTALYLHPRGVLRRELITSLRRNSRMRKPHSCHVLLRGQFADMGSIHICAPTVEDRIIPGHWEGDLINDDNNGSCIGVLVERTSRFVLLAKINNSGMVPVLDSFSAPLNTALSSVQTASLRTSNYVTPASNNRTEHTGIQIYLADPRADARLKPVENTSALLRQHIPAGADVAIYSQGDLDAIALSLNTRPRLPLGWKTPLAIYAGYMARLDTSRGSGSDVAI